MSAANQFNDFHINHGFALVSLFIVSNFEFTSEVINKIISR